MSLCITFCKGFFTSQAHTAPFPAGVGELPKSGRHHPQTGHGGDFSKASWSLVSIQGVPQPEAPTGWPSQHSPVSLPFLPCTPAESLDLLSLAAPPTNYGLYEQLKQRWLTAKAGLRESIYTLSYPRPPLCALSQREHAIPVPPPRLHPVPRF